MLCTDLNGLYINLKKNQIFHLFILLGICILLYTMLAKYIKPRNEFVNTDINMLYILNSQDPQNPNNTQNSYCRADSPKMDEAIIRNMIDLPNRDPSMLTTSMVVPEPSKPNDETIRKTRMDILNMFYNSFDDDLTTIKARPTSLYIIP